VRKTDVPEEPAEQPKPQPDAAPPAAGSADQTTPPTAEGTGTPSAADQTGSAEASQASSNLTEPLTDGTKPVVLTTADKAKPREMGKGGRGGLSAVYRRADIVSTIITFAAALVAAGLVLGGYIYFTRTTAKPTTPPKLTTLSNDEITKLGGFLSGNKAGESAEVLTINSSSLFKNRLAIDSDLKVTGAISASGPTALGDLIVDKISTLGVTNIRGQLSVSGPLTVHSPAVLENGASLTGNLTVSANGTFGGTLGAGTVNTANLSVNTNLNVGGHINMISGNKPGVGAMSRAGSGASASLDGNDTAGTVSFSTGSGAIAGELVQVTFKSAYSKNPRVLLTPANPASAGLQYYVIKSGTFFMIAAANTASNQSYAFDYWVVQ
jgi:hypothetical protein